MTTIPAQRALLGASVTLVYQHRDADGEPSAAGGTPSVVVLDAAGSTVTVGAVGAGTGTGVYEAVVAAADSPRTDLWFVTWTADAVDHDLVVAVVGNVYFDTDTVRGLETSLGGETKYPDATLIERRAIVEFEAERITNRAFVPRFSVAVLDGGTDEIVLPEWDIRSVRFIDTIGTDGTATAWTADEIANVTVNNAAGVLSVYGYWPTRVRVGFEFGLDRPPDDVRTAAAKRLRWHMNRETSTIPDRATSYTVDGGTFRIQTATADKTGDDDVDAVYHRWTRFEASVG